MVQGDNCVKDAIDIVILGAAAWFGLLVGGALVSRVTEDATMEAEDKYRTVADDTVADDIEQSEPMRLPPVVPAPQSPAPRVAPSQPPDQRATPGPVSKPTNRWDRTMAEAITDANARGVPVLVLFSGPGCPNCELVKRNVLTDKAVQRELADYAVVAVDGEREPLLADKFEVTEYPLAFLYFPASGVALPFVPSTVPNHFLTDLRFTLNLKAKD